MQTLKRNLQKIRIHAFLFVSHRNFHFEKATTFGYLFVVIHYCRICILCGKSIPLLDPCAACCMRLSSSWPKALNVTSVSHLPEATCYCPYICQSIVSIAELFTEEIFMQFLKCGPLPPRTFPFYRADISSSEHRTICLLLHECRRDVQAFHLSIDDVCVKPTVVTDDIVCLLERFIEYVKYSLQLLTPITCVLCSDAPDKESLTKQTTAVVVISVILGIIISIIDLVIKFGFDKILQLG